MADKRLLTGVRLPANVTFTNGAGSLSVGNHFSTGFSMSGIVQQIEQEGEHIVVTLEGGDQFVLYGSGMYGEVAKVEEKPKKKAAP